MILPESFERLSALFRKFPGVGEKSARRMAFFLLRQQPAFSEEMARLLLDIREKVRMCPECGNLTEESPCAICRDPLRNSALLCVVESAEDLLSIEQSGSFNGRYFVLGARLSPLDHEEIPVETLSRLAAKVEAEEIEEVLIATNPRVEGDLTAFAVMEALASFAVRTTRLAYGIPLGGNIGFADRMTLAAAIEARSDMPRMSRGGRR